MMMAEGTFLSTQEIYEILKQEIVNLEYVPRQQISENEIAQRFKVSRTPVKAAFTRLESEGFLVIQPQRGSFVSLLDIDRIKDIIFGRLVLEAEVVSSLIHKLSDQDIVELESYLDAQKKLIDRGHFEVAEFYRWDAAFHGAFFEKSGHRYLWEDIQRLEVHYTRFRMLDIKLTKSFPELYAEHLELLEAVKAKDAQAYRARITPHLSGNLKRLDSLMHGEIKDYFLQNGNEA